MPQPLMHETIQRHWRQIINSLAESQPECGEDLYSGATGQYLSNLEWYLGQPLPAELKALYRLNNGQGRLGSGFVIKMFDGGLFEGYYFLPLGGVAQMWQQICAQPYASQQGALTWIPFARDVQGHILLCLDMRQWEGKIPGQVIEVTLETGSLQVLAPDLVTYLEQLGRQVMWLRRQRSGWQRGLSTSQRAMMRVS